MADRNVPEIPSGSMADIAFLLLIFFLVTTTIDSDKGIRRKLPPLPDPDQEEVIVKANTRNVLFVLINSNDDMLVKGEPARIENLREITKEFVDNKNRSNRKDYSESPQDAIVSLKNDIGTSYNMYIQVQNEVAAAYRELRDAYAIKKFGAKFDELEKESDKKKVRAAYPMRVSEAEPNVSN